MIQVFFEKINDKIFKNKVNFSICNTEETKTLIIPIYYMKKGACQRNNKKD